MKYLLLVCWDAARMNADTEPVPAPRNLALVIAKRLRLQGVLVSDHADLQPRFVKDVAGWLASGELKYRETTVEAIEHERHGLWSGDGGCRRLARREHRQDDRLPRRRPLSEEPRAARGCGPRSRGAGHATNRPCACSTRRTRPPPTGPDP